MLGVPDDLYGAPVDMGAMRAVVAAAMLRDWPIEAADVEGAYLVAELRGPPHLREATPSHLGRSWRASG